MNAAPALPPLGAEEAVMDAALAAAITEVRTFGASRGFLAPHLCGCDDRECPNARLETLSFAGVLRAVATEWIADPDPAPLQRLRERLLAFGRTFDLFSCPCGEPGCPVADAPAGDARTVLRAVADAWHGRAGNRVVPTQEAMQEQADRLARNQGMLDQLALRLDPARADLLIAVSRRAARDEHRAWPAEARAMAAEALATWVRDATSMPEVLRVLRRAASVGLEAGWSVADTAFLERAAADACSAILTLGTADDSVAHALWGPFEGVESLADLDAEVDALLIADGAL